MSTVLDIVNLVLEVVLFLSPKQWNLIDKKSDVLDV